MIALRKVYKRYGSFEAVRDLSFQIGKGELVGFLGPNGAGKTSTLRMLSGFTTPSEGSITIAGIDMVADPERAKGSIGYMPEAAPIYPEMRVIEYLSFRADLKGVERSKKKKEVERVMEAVAVLDVANVPVGDLSKGTKQRVGIADALLGSPPVLLLDEPTSGLDPNQIVEVRRVLSALKNDHTVLLSTHILGEIESIATRVLVMQKGSLVAEGSAEELRQERLGGTLIVRVAVRDSSSPSAGDEALPLETLPIRVGEKFERIERSDWIDHEVPDEKKRSLRVRWKKGVPTSVMREDTEDLVAFLVSRHIRVSEVRFENRLEDVFRELTLVSPGAPPEVRT